MKTSTILAWGVLVVVVVALGLYALDKTYPATYSSIFPSGASSTSSTMTGTGTDVTPSGAVTYYCQQGQINATFSTGAVQIDLSDGSYFVLPQVESGSGIRYEATTTAGKDELFQSEGSSASLSQANVALYSNCVAAHVADAGGGFKTFLDQSGTFSFTFPNTYSIVGTAPGYSTDWMVNATSSGMLLAEVQLPSTAMPKTNFVGASFTVGTSADPAALSSCLEARNGAVLDGTVTVNGVTFSKFTESSAGAGNVYLTTSYRVLRDNQCYALEDTIHSSDIDNYPAGSVTAFNEATVQSQLAAIVESFKFIQ